MANEAIYFSKVPGMNHATVIWDTEKRDRALVEFDKQGLYKCKDPKIAKKLRELGYAQVTAETIKKYGFMLPEELSDAVTRQSGRGYQPGEGGPSINLIKFAKGPMPIHRSSEEVLQGAKAYSDGITEDNPMDAPEVIDPETVVSKSTRSIRKRTAE